MKGKIAVITGCHQCPYKAFDSELFIGNESKNTEVAYCGYHKVGYDGSQINLEKIINWEEHIENWNPTEEEPEYPLIPKNCPLPEGDDKANKYGK